MKQWKQLVVVFMMAIGVVSVVVPAGQASAINVFPQCGSSADSQVCQAQKKDDANKMIKTVINTLLTILGTIAVIMIVIGGLRYVTSSGDASHVKAAKDTILYSVVGLVVAILAYSIVNFVLTAFK
jgi:hypothetical protein